MKTTLLLKQNILKLALFASITVSSVSAKAQSGPGGGSSSSAGLSFTNGSIEPGYTAGNDGAVYRFPQVNNTADALVKITGRSSSLVKLTTIDLTNTGYDKAFQPQVSYNNGTVNSTSSWWMEFEVKFVHKNTSNAITLSSVYATGLDIDGDDDKLKEFNTFYGSNYYTLENSSSLSINSVVGTLLQVLTGGKKFTGVTIDHPGVDTLATELMTTNIYSNVNTVTIRVGATTSGASENTDRMHAIWFKNFTYNTPFTTLPVKLVSFTATLNNNNKVDLKWATATETNVSHFIVERSTDGINFSDAGMVFAYGNTTAEAKYSLSDNISSLQSGVVYYRLCTVDADGRTEYSDIRIIKISKQAAATIAIATYPNPVSSEVRITIPAEWQSKKVVFEMFSANGQAVKRMEVGSSSQTETLNVANLNTGLYIVKATCEGKTAQQKIVKQ